MDNYSTLPIYLGNNYGGTLQFTEERCEMSILLDMRYEDINDEIDADDEVLIF